MQICSSVLLGRWGGVRRADLRQHYEKHFVIARDSDYLLVCLLKLNSPTT